MSPLRKLIPGLAVLALVLFLSASALVPPAYAADFRGGDRIVIAADQVVDDDLYVAANEIVIDGTVKGDVYAIAESITVNGTVEYDLNAAAQSVTINGTVGSDTHLAAQTIVLGENANVTRSQIAAAFSLETKSGSRIGNDLLSAAYQALLAGSVGKDVVAAGNGIELNGTVGRNVRVSVGDSTTGSFNPRLFMRNVPVSVPVVPAGLTIGPSAQIGGDLIYEAQQPANVVSGSQVSGPIVQQTPVPNDRGRPERLTPAQQQAQRSDAMINGLFDQGRRFIVLLLLGLLAVWLLPKFIGALAEAIRTKPLGSLGRGLLMVVGFIAALFGIAIVTILFALFFGVLTLGSLASLTVATGIVTFGVLTFAYSVFTSYVAPIVVSFLLGRTIFDRVQASWAQNRFIAFIVGLILLSLASLVPILNVLIGLLVAIVALGALVIWFSARRSGTQAAVMQAA